jgi:hypothetical protein
MGSSHRGRLVVRVDIADDVAFDGKTLFTASYMP